MGVILMEDEMEGSAPWTVSFLAWKLGTKNNSQLRTRHGSLLKSFRVSCYPLTGLNPLLVNQVPGAKSEILFTVGRN